MARNKTPLGIFTESIGLYFSNFDKFISFMTFPVMGQIIGLILIFSLVKFFINTAPKAIQSIPALDNTFMLTLSLILLVLPGLIIFLKAFWEYLIAYGAVNSMLENMLKSGKVYDFDAHTELIKRRVIPFIGLWTLFGIYSLISVIPFFWVISAVFAVFFVLIFQVFTYEPELSPIGCAKRSLQLVKGHFASTFMLIALIGALTYILIPQLINLFCEYTYITKFLSNLIVPIINNLPISEFNSILSYLYLPNLNSEKLSLFFITTFIAQIFIQYTLPMRSILWGMWYKELNGGKLGVIKEQTKSKKKFKKPSENLMESSHRKYSSKKLDRNILRRAMEKDDES